VTLGNKKSTDLETVFTNSMFRCFVFNQNKLIGAGRALADGIDCSYICDVAVHPEFQGLGIGKNIISKLIELSADHKKIILYASPGKESFYKKLGFKRMNTAMVIFEDQNQAVENGLVNET
jgi:ribosomal protein S18 acetylase RimI-like enzyme